MSHMTLNYRYMKCVFHDNLFYPDIDFSCSQPYLIGENHLFQLCYIISILYEKPTVFRHAHM